MPPPKPVVDLVERFERDRKVFLSSGPSIRHSDFDIRTFPGKPFFESLGWEVSNKAGLTEVYKPVIHEESIKVAGATKAPDYTFRISTCRPASSPLRPLSRHLCDEEPHRR